MHPHLIYRVKVSVSPASPTPLSDPPLVLWAEIWGDKGATTPAPTPNKSWLLLKAGFASIMVTHTHTHTHTHAQPSTKPTLTNPEGGY